MSTAEIVVGLGWGDEAKGATVDFLSTTKPTNRIVRFNGGQQAAHNVVHNGTHHTFSNYSSGTYSNIPTWISEHCTIDPISALSEQKNLNKILTDTTSFIHVHEKTKVTTPLHILVNRIRETERGENRHGSTGTGFGETIAWEYYGNEPLRAGHMKNRRLILSWLHEYKDCMQLEIPDKQLEEIAEQLRSSFEKTFKIVTDEQFSDEISSGHTIFEGAQGFLLDENFGQPPHNTWSTTTPANAKSILRKAGVSENSIQVYGCLRTYATRHGAGPMPYENVVKIPEPHNATDEWAGNFRTGVWDWELLTWAIERVKPDFLSISWLDVFEKFQTSEGERELSDLAPVGIIATGPERSDRKLLVG